MKLLVVMAGDDYAQPISDCVIEGGYHATTIGSSGEFLQYGKTVMLIGVENKQVQEVVTMIEKLNCHEEVEIYVIPAYDFFKTQKV